MFLLYCTFSRKGNIRNVGNLDEWILTSLAESFGWSPRKSACAHVPEVLCTLAGRRRSPGADPLKLITPG